MSEPANTGAYSQPTTSVWMQTADMPAYGPLREDVEVDVCVVGAGIAGLSTAYELAAAGRRVLVLERGHLGGGNTGRTTAHLSSVIDDRFAWLEKVRGPDGARLARESHAAAIHRIAEIVRDERIDCDFERVDGYLCLAEGDREATLDDELEAARRAGFSDAEKRNEGPVAGLGPCLRFPNQAQFHPLKYLAGLSRGLSRLGGRVCLNTAVTEVTGGDAPVVRTVAGHSVRAGVVVVATNSPITDRVALHTKQAPYTTYAIGLRVDCGAVPRGLYWDTADPYHYVRLQWVPGLNGEPPCELLIVGGEDHRTGQASDGARRFAALEAWARTRFPGVGPVLERWSGMVFESIDGLGFIGVDPSGGANVYVVTGDSGMGMTHAAIAGLLIRDLALGRENPWTELYEPSRKPLRAAGPYIKENFNVALQYAGWIGGGEVRSINEIEPGHGALYGRGLRKLAVYRDPHGQVHACSAHCPHLGAPVEWNPVEHTWDCTAHGSRFDPCGEVLNGPANSDLPAAATDDLS